MWIESASGHAPRLLGSLLLAITLPQTITVQAAAIQEIVFQKEAPGHLGGVASESRECSAIGRDLLARGGNAVDALVGTTFCVGVIGMYHSGIGGGGFAMLRDADGEYEAIDFREAAPAAAFEDMYKNNVSASTRGGLAVGVPSEIKGLEYMHTKYGVLPWKIVMQGAIHVARNGFRVSGDLIRYMSSTINADGGTFLTNDPNWAADFAPDGDLVKEGAWMTRKRYADTLQKVSENGSEIFYSGEIAKAIVDYVQRTGGSMTVQDMANYKVVIRPVHNVTYRGLTLHGIGSPAGGAVSLQILKIMERYNSEDWSDQDLTRHRLTEAMRFAYAARISLGDPEFVDADVEGFEKEMLDPRNIDAIYGRIWDNQTHATKYYNPEDSYVPENHGTSHIVAADKAGMAVSLTTTVNLLFGAKIIEPQTGIILNNEMNDFSIPGVSNEFGFAPSVANYIRPGKRPLSSITPIIAAFPNGTLYAAIGAAGGSRIISATAQVLWHVLDNHDATLAGALQRPRLHDQLMPNTVLLEEMFDDEVAVGLEKRGHNVTWVRPGLSSVQAVRRFTDGVFEAASEPRQKNSAGYTL
ncbi:gamma-glutamyltranspeptidase [Trichoderma ceciliae]